MILQRYRKPLIGALVAVVVYALLGFFGAPWLVNQTATNAARDDLGVELEMQNVSVNPFVLSVQIDGLDLKDPQGEPFLSIERLFVNFQLSSLFRWALTFREFHVDSPELHLERDGGGEFNFGFLSQRPGEIDAPGPDTESGPPRLLIQDFAVSGSTVRWRDQMPPEPVDTYFGPVNISISELNTLPDRAGLQDVVIMTETQGTLSWSGSLELNPLRSEGRAAIRGSHFPLTSAYLKHELGFDVVDGVVDVELDYRVDTRPDGSMEARVGNFEMSVHDLIVHTFNQALGRAGADREVMKLPLVRLWGGEFRWPEKTVSALGISIDDGVVSLVRDPAGALNVQPADLELDTNEAEPEPVSAEPAGDPWRVSLSQLSINRLALSLEDQTLDPVPIVGWRSLDLEVRDISNQPATQFPTMLRIEALDGGSISLDGRLSVLPEPTFDFDLAIEALDLGAADPYVKSLANVHLESGLLSVAAKLRRSGEDPLAISGEFEILDFLLTESGQGTRLGSWASLKAEKLAYSSAGKTIEISEVRIAQPYGDILIAADGSVNLGRVRKSAGAEGEEGSSLEPAEEDAGVQGARTAVTIGRVVVSDAAADFADLSLPLPFAAKIAALNGEISTIATTSSEPSTVKMEGNVDEFGRVQVSGTVTPLDLSANTNVRVDFENVDMPKFSAYSIPFAGREIASGRLDLNLGYTISEGALVGENRVVLREFELGDKVDHPDALSLPLGLAVALLKDPNGRIDLDVPVRGDVNDPEFKYGAVVAKALINLLTRIVTAPFALLGNLVGVEADELEYLVFAPGRADLPPPELEKVGKIAEALGLRPQLALQIGGAYAPDDDAAALKAGKVDQAIADLIDAAADDDTMYADKRRESVEQLFTEMVADADKEADADMAASLEEIRALHTTEGEDGERRFDALAYTEALRSRLIDAQPLSEAEIVSLGAARAENVQQAILAKDPQLGARIAVDEPKAVDVDEDERVRMKLTLQGL